MGKKYEQLSLEERCTISIFQKEGKSIRQIGAALDRSPSTISREIKRNTTKTKGYQPKYAQLQTAGRRWQGSRLERQTTLRNTVLNLLAMGWSPQQISGRLAHEQGCNVISYESIYRFIYAQLKRTNDYSWRKYLPRAKSKRGFRGRKGGSPTRFIKDRVAIENRPAYVKKRESPGHWEADLMLFSEYGKALLIAHERCSRVLMAFKLRSKKADAVVKQLINLFDCLPKELTKSMTFDNGTEFARHHRLNDMNINTYFCDVGAPWQKGGVENAIGRLRRFLPRKTDLSKLSVTNIEQLLQQYNHTPRKCLGYKTPAEIFTNQLLHFKCELTPQPSLG